jgi:hypothetical protein
MKSFLRFVDEEYGIQSDYAHPSAPQHDLWKHGLPALRNKYTMKIVIGKRGEHHQDLADEHGTERGIWHRKEKKFYKCGKDTDMDSTDLMTPRQRMERGY